MPQDFSASTENTEREDLKIVHLIGELDELSVESLKTQIDPILNNNDIREIIMDLTSLEFINSKGIGYLVSIHTHLTKNARVLKLAGASSVVLDVLNLVGLTSILPYFNTLEEAKNS